MSDEAVTETVVAGVEDVATIAARCKEEIAAIDGLPKKSNYHNARKSAYKAILDLIEPPAPKPVKEKKPKKTKEEKAAEKAEAKAAAAAGNSTPEVEGETSVEPIEEGA